jgi:hypothetical protein
MKRNLLGALVAFAALAAGVVPPQAQSYPTRP